MIELCGPYRGNQLPHQSDTRFSSYKGSKVCFYTFFSNDVVCVYWSIKQFQDRVHIIEGNFFDKNRHVIQGRLWAKSCQLILMTDILGQNVNEVGARFPR